MLFIKKSKVRLISKVLNKMKNFAPGYQLNKKKWEFHLTDDDFFPSVPHGHSGKYKLNIDTGAIIDTTTGANITFLSKKDFRRLLTDPKFLIFAHRAREYYKSRNPGVILPQIEIAENRTDKSGTIRQRGKIPVRYRRNLKYCFTSYVDFK